MLCGFVLLGLVFLLMNLLSPQTGSDIATGATGLCVCVCVCARARASARVRIETDVHQYIQQHRGTAQNQKYLHGKN